MTKLSKKKIRQAIQGSYGIITTIAKRCQVTRKALYEFLNKNPELWKEIQAEREKIIDHAEAVLFKKVVNEEWKAVEFLLRNLGKERGYAEKHIIDTETSITIKDIEDRIMKIIGGDNG